MTIEAGGISPSSSKTARLIFASTVLAALIFVAPPSHCSSINWDGDNFSQFYNNTVVDLNWKFNHILILPVGCSWAGGYVWRISLKCPTGHFIVPTRLLASTNRNLFCYNETLLFENETLSFQRENQFSYMKQVRQIASQIYGDGRLNTYDYPYFPIYNVSASPSYWNCIGVSSSSAQEDCTLVVRASDFAGRAASHGFDEIATLVLPGPYCSTVDMFDHYDRSGGIVYKTQVDPTTKEAKLLRAEYKISRDDIDALTSSNNITLSRINNASESDPRQDTPANSDFQIAAVPSHLRQSEDIFFVGNSYEQNRNVSYCTATLLPRDVNFALSLWRRNQTLFFQSLLANIHVTFVRMTYNGYSTFYDDMTALQHDRLWRNMFTLNSVDNSTGQVTLSINFTIARRTDNQRLWITLVLYEILIVGDDHAQLLGRAWPYRYKDRSREMASRLVLLRNATVDRCELEIAPDDDKSLYDQTPPPANEISATFPPRSPPCFWCLWLWIVIGCLVIFVTISTIAVLLLCHYRYRGSYYVYPRRQQYCSSDSPSLLMAAQVQAGAGASSDIPTPPDA